MIQDFIELVAPLIFLLICVISAGYWFNKMWLNYDDIQEDLLRKNKERKDQFPLIGPYTQMANLWIKHWTYKWFSRIITLIILVTGGFVLIAYILHLLELLVLDLGS